MANKGPTKANRNTSHFTALLIVHFISLTCSVHHSLWGLCRFAYHVLLLEWPTCALHQSVREIFFFHRSRSSRCSKWWASYWNTSLSESLASRRSAVDGISGMRKHKKHKKGKKKREKQDKLERRERPGEWNLHIKWSFIDCRHSHAWKLEGCYKS